MKSSKLVRTIAVVSAVAASLVLAQAGPADAASTVSSGTSQSTVNERCGVIDFDKATVVADAKTGVRRKLVVTGEAPMAPLSVALEPLVYVTQPDYWGIEVVGCFPLIGLPVMTPFTAELDIAATTGKVGVEVIGATKTQKLVVNAPVVAGS